MEPWVSVPIPKATHAAAVADPGPADDPLDPSSTFHGFRVLPRYHWSPRANSPVASLAASTAPASRSRTTTWESYRVNWLLKSAAPQVVRVPRAAKRSLRP